MARILVIEDEQGQQKGLDYNLRKAGHEVIIAVSGAEGLTLAQERRPDLILLDWVLPDVTGPDVCRALKRAAGTRAIPVIFVTARGDEVDRIVGFELGAADYVVKPFSVRELVLRVQAVLRRREGASQRKSVSFGCLRIDEDAHRVWSMVRRWSLPCSSSSSSSRSTRTATGSRRAALCSMGSGART